MEKLLTLFKWSIMGLGLSIVLLIVLSDYNSKKEDLQYFRYKSTYTAYTFERLPVIEQELRGKGISPSGPVTGELKKDFGSNVPLQVYCYLKKFGFNDLAAAAVMGNIEAESEFRPAHQEVGVPEPHGHGLFQLTNHKKPNEGRSTNMRAWVSPEGHKYPSVDQQMLHFEWEVKGVSANAIDHFYKLNFHSYKRSNPGKYDHLMDKSLVTGGWEPFKNYTGSIDVLTAAFMMGFERPSFYEKWNHLLSRRIPSAKKLYEEYKGRQGECFTQSTIATQTGSGNDLRSRALEIAKQQIGKPYIWGAEGPDTFDCSGLVYYSYSKAGLQFTERSYTLTFHKQAFYKEIPCDQVQPGDLIFTNPSWINHVVFALTPIGKNGKYLHAPQKNDIVKISDGIPPYKSYMRCATFQ